MSQLTHGASNTPHVSDLIAERKRNLTRVIPVRNLHKSATLCSLGPNEIGTITPMQALQHRAWMRKLTIDEGVTDDELLGRAKPKKAPKAKEGPDV